ncbi:hypothetical protein HK103_003760 [Boothiomyces macroporosus]|uniref:Transmembrane protein 198 n=1 Tax=Boothiomyces macroporosus TaxID=261099 RepID=A0AAD5Y4G6_9FUNG|nr:hypothetical protein HK103_003760 [Boothiomyces macroporosus]
MSPLFMIFCMIMQVLGAPVLDILKRDTTTSSYTGQDIFIAAIAIVGGLFLLFSGYRLFRAALYLAGFVFFANLALYLMLKFEPSSGYSHRDILLLIVPIVAGILGGFLAQAIWRIGLSLIGFLAGGALAMLLLSLKDGGLISSQGGQLAFILVVGIICAVAIHWFEIPAIIGGTSLIGAYSFMYGVDIFAKTGFTAAVQSFLFGSNPYQTVVFTASTSITIMVIATLVLAAIGAYSQYRTTRNHKHRTY